MASLQHPSSEENRVPVNLLIANIARLHASLCKLESLRPSNRVNNLFTQLVELCTLPSPIDVKLLSPEMQLVRSSLINLCARAEGLLELEFSTFLTKLPHSINHINLFPYYNNYVKLAGLEYKILIENNGAMQPKRIAFVGSGPMPLTSILLATDHLRSTCFVNYDIDEKANHLASRLIKTDDELARRMSFRTCDIRDVREELGEFDCVFLAALVGMSKEEKVEILGHVGKYMKRGGFLLVRSAKGARAFLYPVVEEEDLLSFETLAVYHPNDDVINSVILLRKPIIL